MIKTTFKILAILVALIGAIVYFLSRQTDSRFDPEI